MLGFKEELLRDAQTLPSCKGKTRNVNTSFGMRNEEKLFNENSLNYTY